MFERLFDIWYYVRTALRLKDFTIVNVDEQTGTIDYTCNNRVYKVVQKWPIGRKPGVSFPIKSATLQPTDGSEPRDVTDLVKQWAGPRNDFYGLAPDIGFWFHYRRRRSWWPRVVLRHERPGYRLVVEWLTEPLLGDLKIVNIVGQESIFAAK
jgi:hypothetical protein